MSDKTLSLIKDHRIEWVDLRFTDSRGKEQHMSIPAGALDAAFFRDGKMFDGSSIAGWKSINESDMLLMPDDSTAVLDPFMDDPTLLLRCTIHDPDTGARYSRDPRGIAQRAEEYLVQSGMGDRALFGPEPEFFILDGVRFGASMSGCFFEVHSEESAWSPAGDQPTGGHRPAVKGGYFPVPPVDSLHDVRAAMATAMQQMGLAVEVHHHEVGNSGQCEIGVAASSLTLKADEVQMLKYCVHNVAQMHGKTATFMPKPLVGENGSGMHIHQSIGAGGKNLFAGDGYAGLSDLALHYMGGIIKHSRAICALSNASTNSYKRLVPGFEAPVVLAYSAANRSAAIRIPAAKGPGGRRIEVRYPDATANPYLVFAAMLMAGIDGIKNRLPAGDPADIDLYDLPPEQVQGLPRICDSLEDALQALDGDRDFLKAGNVFSDEALDAYIELKSQEAARLRSTTHPVEFDMYYSV